LRRRRLQRCQKQDLFGTIWKFPYAVVAIHWGLVKGDEKRQVVHVKTGKVKPIEGVVMYFDTSYTATRVVRL
jgi:hypothetical protein